MSDARTAPAPRPAINEASAAKKEKRIPPSDAGEQAVREHFPPQDEKPVFGFSESAEGARDRIEDLGKTVRAATAEVVSSARDGQFLQNALLFATRNVETVIDTTNVAMRGAEEVTNTAVEYGQRNIEQLSAMVRKLSEARTFGELVTLQREHALAAGEAMLEEATRLNERLTRTFGEVVETVLRQQAELAGATRRRVA